jgi:hypothetical protein
LGLRPERMIKVVAGIPRKVRHPFPATLDGWERG